MLGKSVSVFLCFSINWVTLKIVFDWWVNLIGLLLAKSDLEIYLEILMTILRWENFLEILTEFWLETWGWEFFKTWALLFCIFWSTKCGIVWLLCTFPCWKVDASLNEVCCFSLFCNVSWFALCTLIKVWEGNYICVSFNW